VVARSGGGSVDAALDVGAGAGALDDGGVVLVDGDLLGAAEVGELDLLELDAEFFHDGLAAGEDGDVLEHGLAAIAEAGGLDGGDLEDAAELVDDEGGEGFAFDILGDDEQDAPARRSCRGWGAGPWRRRSSSRG
jgi:hypothetical protein